MLPFVIIALILILCYYLSLKEKKHKKLILLISFIILISITGLRNQTVGADSKQYYAIYEQISQMNLSQSLTKTLLDSTYMYPLTNIESGYRLYNKIIALFSPFHQGQWILMVNSILYFALLYRFLKHQSKDSQLSLILFVFLGIFQTMLNMTRIGIAIMLCMSSFIFIGKKSYKFIISVFIASTIHFTSILFIIVPFMKKHIKMTKLRLLMVFSLLMVIFFKFDSFIALITKFLPNKYKIYLTSEAATSNGIEQFLVFGFQLLLVLICTIFIKNTKKEKVKLLNLFGTKIFILEMIFYLLSIKFVIFGRIAALFMPYVIVYIPELINLLKNNKNRKTLVNIVIILAFIQYVIRMLVNNIGTTLPYLFFFTK